MKILLFAASSRKESINRTLANRVESQLTKMGHTVDHPHFSTFDCPVFNQDIQEAEGVASGAQELINRMNKSDALIIAVPEYNASIPGTLKNLIDWVSRGKPMPWNGKKILLVTASPSFLGGQRSFWATRIPFECCGSFVYPKTFTLPDAFNAFDDEGAFVDAAVNKRLSTLLKGFASWAQAGLLQA